MVVGDSDGGSELALLLAAILATLGVNAVILRLALSPLRALREAVGRVEGGDLEARVAVPPTADRDFEQVADSFNAMLESVARYRSRLQRIAERARRIEDEERSDVSRALQEEVAQRLASLLVQLRLIGSGASVADAERVLEEARDEIARAMDVVRSYAAGRLPEGLEDLGLAGAVEAYLSRRAAGRPVRAWVEADGDSHGVTAVSDVEHTAYRVLQEAIDNAIEHAEPGEIRVWLERTPGRLVAEVSDDGRGFAVDPALAGEAVGLFEMQEIAAVAGGTLEIDSRAGRGTRVRVSLPTSGFPLQGSRPGPGRPTPLESAE